LLQAAGLLEAWDASLCQDLLCGRGKIFTGAYVVNARHGPKDGPSRTKLAVVCERIEAVWQDKKKLLREIQNNTLENAHDCLQVYLGLGGTGFAAYEIVSDLWYTYLLRNASDIMTWCNVGPGCCRGLARLENDDTGWRVLVLQQNKALVKMVELLETVNQKLPANMP